MTAAIRLNGVPVGTVFDLLGRKENDITYALGWGLAQSTELLAVFLKLCGAPTEGVEDAQIDLQLHERIGGLSGITDIEITTTHARVIVEAKRGWNLPTVEQLKKYAPRLGTPGGTGARLVVLTQWGEHEYVRACLGDEIDGHPIATVGLGDVAKAAERVLKIERVGRTRQVLSELARYLFDVADLRNPHDNRVFVVALSPKMSEAGMSFIDVVNTLGIYWYPVEPRWPKTPHTYMGFRYFGQLQTVHHVDESRVVADLADAVVGVARPSFAAFVLTLGPPIPIPSGIRTGKGLYRGAHALIDIDLLLSASTISEAFAKTRERHSVRASTA